MQWERSNFHAGRQPPYGENSLCHYGVPHMHWGERRYQYANGSYTEEGKKRYGRDKSNGEAPSDEKSKNKHDKAPQSEWKKSDAKELSDEELNRRNNRLQREQQYKNSMTPQWKKETSNIAKDLGRSILKAALVTSVVAAVKVTVGDKVKDATTNFLKKQMNKVVQKDASIKAANIIKDELDRRKVYDEHDSPSNWIRGKHVGHA